jgi:hypothetical protein
VPIEPRARGTRSGAGGALATPLPYRPQRECDAERTRAQTVEASALRQRRRPPDPAEDRLSSAASEWLAALPQPVRPVALAARFPRIANRICALWRRPVRLDAYFDDLLIDRRGDRQGFPLAVAKELNALKDYYRTDVFPVQRSIWDEQYMTSARTR